MRGLRTPVVSFLFIVALICVPALLSAQVEGTHDEGHVGASAHVDETAEETGPADEIETAGESAEETGPADEIETAGESADEAGPADEIETADEGEAAGESDATHEDEVAGEDEAAIEGEAVHEAEPAHGAEAVHEDAAGHETETTRGAEAPHEGAAAHEAEAAHGEGHGSEMLSFVFMSINFLIFAALLFFILRKPIVNFIRERSKGFAEEMEESAKLLEDARKRHEEMKDRLNRMDAEIAELREQMRKEGEAQGDRIIERSRQMVEKIREDAKFQAEQQIVMARQALQEEAARLAVQTAEEILKKSVSDEDHDTLVGRFLKEVKES